LAKTQDLDARRRSLLTSVLAGGAVYALPVVATLSATKVAMAADSSDDGSPGRPDNPGSPGQGPDQRPAAPGEGGRGRNTGKNPHFDDPAQSSQDASDASDYFDGIGKGGPGFA
jgi:hypothetical protein